MAEGTIITALETIPGAIVIEPVIDHVYFPPALIVQETYLSLFFKPAHVEVPSNSLNSIIILLVDPGDLHIPSSFHEEPVIITAASFEIVIGFNNNFSFVVTFVKVPLIKPLIITLIVLLIAALVISLIIALIKWAVIPRARLCLCQGKHSN